MEILEALARYNCSLFVLVIANNSVAYNLFSGNYQMSSQRIKDC